MSGTKKLEPIAWCPGCGNFNILKSLEGAIDKAELDRRNVVVMSGIGQAAKLPHYMDVNMYNGLHGRVLPAATGVKMANHALKVIITSGDGDMYGEGGNHLLHAFRRNIGVTAFVHNNQVYGLTKGQASPTSDFGFTTKIQTHGVNSQPMNAIAIAIIEDISFVGRSSAVLPEHLESMMVEAINARGFALLEILQPCVTFNKVNTFKWYKDRCKPLPGDYDPYDREKAIATALKWGDEIPVGVIYRSNRKSFEEITPALSGEPLVEMCEKTG